MKDRYMTTIKIILLLSLVRSTYGEENQNLLDLMEENALKKYPWMMNEDMTETMVPTSSLRRHGSYPWMQDIATRPVWYRYWYRNTQTFAFDIQYYVRTGGDNIKVRTCHMIITTYLGASLDIRRYFETRYLYLDHIDFEIGYMTHEIIAKYQNLIELFLIARKKYFYNRRKNRAPTKYLFNKYTNIMELSTALVHLCNMFHEIKYKYGQGEPPSQSLFQDSPIEKQAISLGLSGIKPSYNFSAGSVDFDAMYHQGRKPTRPTRPRRTKLQTGGFMSIMTPLPKATTKKSWWPLVYGWSIEKWY